MSQSLVEALAGTGGALIAHVAVYPLDMVKTRLQVQTKSQSSYQYKGTLDALQRILFTEGLKGLYNGLFSSIVQVILTNFVFSYAYSFLRRFQKGEYALIQFVQGAEAAAISQLLTTPVSIITTRIQTSRGGNQMGILETGRNIVREEGWKGLWKGIGPGLVLTVNPAITYFVYEKLRAALEALHRARYPGSSPEPQAPAQPLQQQKAGGEGAPAHGDVEKGSLATPITSSTWALSSPPSSSPTPEDNQRKKKEEEEQKKKKEAAAPGKYRPGPIESFIMGALSKSLATVLTYPYIMAKVRLQWKPESADQGPMYKNTLDVMARVVKENGFAGLFQGLRAQLLKAVLSQAILIMSKEELTVLTWALFMFVRKLFETAKAKRRDFRL